MYAKPNIVISKCIEFDNCRYNGAIIRSEPIKELKEYVHFIPICPEVEIGLGIPREPIRLVQKDENIELMQPATGKILSQDMHTFIDSFFSTLKDIDGFILKSRSPSCGMTDVKLYSTIKKGPAVGKSSGIFGGRVKETYADVVIEDEGRLRNPRIWEHFLRCIYIFARFRETKKKQSLPDLIEFHSNNKFLLMSYHQQHLKTLGQIVSNQSHQKINTILDNYETILKQTFQKATTCARNINVLLHILGFFSNRITSNEKQYFLESVDAYKTGKLSLAAVIRILESWAIRFNEEYLLKQTFFHPYPKELVHIENIDSCSVRDYWK